MNPFAEQTFFLHKFIVMNEKKIRKKLKLKCSGIDAIYDIFTYFFTGYEFNCVSENLI